MHVPKVTRQYRVLCFWLVAPCRTLLGVIRLIKNETPVTVRVYVAKELTNVRTCLGWKQSEYDDLQCTLINQDSNSIRKQILENKDAFHLINGYQNNMLIRKVADFCVSQQLAYGGFSEAPINLNSGYKRLLKTSYLRFILPAKINKFVINANCFVNLSGITPNAELYRIGWRDEQILPFGYFPEPNPILKNLLRKESLMNDRFDPLKILMTGNHEWYRGHDVALRAIKLAIERGVNIETVITGRKCKHNNLNELCRKMNIESKVKFPGLVDQEKLAEYIRDAHLCLATGIEEPWGVRVNDTLMSQLPTFISEGMGISSVLTSISPSLIFKNCDHDMLSKKIVQFYKTPEFRAKVIQETESARQFIDTRFQAKELINKLSGIGVKLLRM